MEILRTNIKENEWTMDKMMSLFESDDRHSLSEAEGNTLEVVNYAIYETTFSNGEIKKLISIETPTDVYVSSSPTFIEKFETKLMFAEKTKTELKTITVTRKKGNNGRYFLTLS